MKGSRCSSALVPAEVLAESFPFAESAEAAFGGGDEPHAEIAKDSRSQRGEFFMDGVFTS
jgi:hypothetical protein